MADHAEEQEMEAEALQAIFDTHFSILGPGKWSVEIYPEMTADYDELDQLNHVGVTLLAELPDNYPEALPVLDCQILKGLVDEHKRELLELAKEEAAANEGVPSIYAITERLRDWLVENNQKGLDDLSMHAQMLRKQQAKEREVGETRRGPYNHVLLQRIYMQSSRGRSVNWFGYNATCLRFGGVRYGGCYIMACVFKILSSIGAVGDRRQGGC